nr:hypothetical protein [uncultured Methanolobus sp.]
MDAIKGIPILLLFLLVAPVNVVYAETGADYDAYKDKWDLLYEDKSDWLCFDYSIDYARNHPGWGMVILSPSPSFRFQPHMVNYKIEGNMLYIHEPQANRTYELEIVNGSMNVPLYDDFPNDFSSQWARPTYFHFIPNESGVRRTYYALPDNRNEFFDYANLSISNVSETTAVTSTKTTSTTTNATTTTIATTATMTEQNQSSAVSLCEYAGGNETIYNANTTESEKPESFTIKIMEFARSLFGL